MYVRSGEFKKQHSMFLWIFYVSTDTNGAPAGALGIENVLCKRYEHASDETLYTNRDLENPG